MNEKYGRKTQEKRKQRHKWLDDDIIFLKIDRFALTNDIESDSGNLSYF